MQEHLEKVVTKFNSLSLDTKIKLAVFLRSSRFRSNDNTSNVLKSVIMGGKNSTNCKLDPKLAKAVIS